MANTNNESVNEKVLKTPTIFFFFQWVQGSWWGRSCKYNDNLAFDSRRNPTVRVRGNSKVGEDAVSTDAFAIITPTASPQSLIITVNGGGF